MNERVALIHIGTHKTGTTSLQLFFDTNQERFGSTSIYVTRSGRYMDLVGNHQVGWELLSSNDSPHARELFAELRGIDDRVAIVTSEDLCLLYARPAALAFLREGIESAGFVPKIVVYLRAQAPYAESLYIERAKAKYILDIKRYLDEIFDTGRYCAEDSAIQLEFMYTRLLEPFVQTFGASNVIIRPYVQTGDAFHIFRDFLEVLRLVYPDFAKSKLSLTVSSPRANDTLTYWDLLRDAYAVCTPAGDPPLSEDFRAVFAPAEPDIYQSKVRLLNRDEYVAIAEQFAADNDWLLKRFGVRIEGSALEDIAPADDPRWQIARRQRELYEKFLALWLTRKASSQQPRE